MKGLRCDNPNCDYEDLSIERKDYEKYLSIPCPLCGSTLLTKEDYQVILDLEKLENNFFYKMKSFFCKENYSIELNGTGYIGAKVIKKEEYKKILVETIK